MGVGGGAGEGGRAREGRDEGVGEEGVGGWVWGERDIHAGDDFADRAEALLVEEEVVGVVDEELRSPRVLARHRKRHHPPPVAFHNLPTPPRAPS